MSLLSDLITSHNKANYEYQRWLMLIAAGAFSLTAGVAFGKPFAGCQLLALKAALSANVIGILCGAISIFGETAMARGVLLLACDKQEHIERGNHEAAASVRLAYQLPWLYKVSEWAFYLSLSSSLVLWVIFIWLG